MITPRPTPPAPESSCFVCGALNRAHPCGSVSCGWERRPARRHHTITPPIPAVYAKEIHA